MPSSRDRGPRPATVLSESCAGWQEAEVRRVAVQQRRHPAEAPARPWLTRGLQKWHESGGRKPALNERPCATQYTCACAAGSRSWGFRSLGETTCHYFVTRAASVQSCYSRSPTPAGEPLRSLASLLRPLAIRLEDNLSNACVRTHQAGASRPVKP